MTDMEMLRRIESLVDTKSDEMDDCDHPNYDENYPIEERWGFIHALKWMREVITEEKAKCESNETIKIVINACFGGFRLSKEAYDYLGLEWDEYGDAFSWPDGDRRTDPKLVECVETLGEKASGNLSRLKVVEVPANVDWSIEDYDGSETVCESHRSWW